MEQIAKKFKNIRITGLDVKENRKARRKQDLESKMLQGGWDYVFPAMYMYIQELRSVGFGEQDNHSTKPKLNAN